MNTNVAQSAVQSSQHPTVVRRHPCCDHYDALLRRLRLSQNGSAVSRIIGVVGCQRQAGVSTVAANLAIRAADTVCDSVLLVDADTDNPALPRAFGLKQGAGWVDMLAGSAEPVDCVQTSRVERLSLLPAGTSSGTAPVYRGPRLAECLTKLRQNHDLIIVDLPPADPLSACLDLAGQLDGVLLVIEAEKTRAEAALRVKQLLVEQGAPLLGVVLNKRRTHVPDWLYRRL